LAGLHFTNYSTNVKVEFCGIFHEKRFQNFHECFNQSNYSNKNRILSTKAYLEYIREAMQGDLKQTQLKEEPSLKVSTRHVSLTDIINSLINIVSLIQLETKTNFYKQCWPLYTLPLRISFLEFFYV
jgi:hypothetical protein